MLTQLTYAQIGERLSIGSEDFCTGIDLSHFQLTFADEFDSFDWSPDGSIGWRTTLDWGNRTLPPQQRGPILFGCVGRCGSVLPARRRSGHHRDGRIESTGPAVQ